MAFIQLKGEEADIYRAWCDYFTKRDGQTRAETRTHAFIMARRGEWPTWNNLPLVVVTGGDR